MAEMKNAAEILEGGAEEEGPSKCCVHRMRHSGAPGTCAENQTVTTPVTTPTQNKTTQQGFLSPIVVSRDVLAPPPTPRKPQPAKSRVPYKVGRCLSHIRLVGICIWYKLIS